jgi:hypothetical protein
MANQPTTARAHWIVQGDEVASGRLMERVKQDAEITLVRQIAPDVCLLAMTPERADKLKKEAGPRLVVEPDADLKLSSGPGGP